MTRPLVVEPPVALEMPEKALVFPTAAAKPVEVQVASLDWKWLFIYPDEGVASVNELALPVGVPVHFTLTSTGPTRRGSGGVKTVIR